MIGTLLWQYVERRLRWSLPPEAVSPALGDLAEDYARRVRTDGGASSAIWLLREARSLARAYRPARPRRRAALWPARSAAALLADVRLALRSLARHPGLAAAAILPVALAIAATTALYSVADGLLYREIRQVRDPASMVEIRFDPRGYVTHEHLRQARELIRETVLVGDRIWLGSGLTGSAFHDAPEREELGIVERIVSPNFFDVLGARPVAGRGFEPDDAGSQPRTVILGHDLWRIHFGADPSVAGTTVALAGVGVHVAGVAPPGFRFPRNTNVWTAYDVPADAGPPTYARLAPGATLGALQAASGPLQIRPLAEAVRPDGALAVAFLFAATALFLLVSWLQVGALLFARAAGRAREIGVALALGATRARLLRAFAADGLVVAAVALALGWLAAPRLVGLVVGLLPPEITQNRHVDPDGRTLAFASAMAAAGLLLLSVLPLDLVRRGSPVHLLRGEPFGYRLHPAGRLRASLLVGQVALTAVLLYMSGLVLHSFVRITGADLGFDPRGLLVWSVPRGHLTEGTPRTDPAARRAADARMRLFYGQVTGALDELRAHPAILTATGSRYRPLLRAQAGTALSLPSRPDAGTYDVRYNWVLPDYFDALGIRVVEGRTFAAPDHRETRDVVVVNETLAAYLASFGPVVGQQVQSAVNRPARIIGIARDHVDRAPDEPVSPQLFLPVEPVRAVSLWLGIVRARPGHEDAARAAIATVVARTWGGDARTIITPMAQEFARVTSAWRGRTILLALVAALCVLLALVGLAGAIGYDTRRRAHEIAVRLALGADGARIRRAVVARAVGLAGLGLLVGIVGGWAVGRLMAAYLYAVSPADAATTAGVAAVLLAGGWLAALVPASRAARVEAAVTLKDPN